MLERACVQRPLGVLGGGHVLTAVNMDLPSYFHGIFSLWSNTLLTYHLSPFGLR